MTKPTGRPVGRPSKYSEALADRIVEALIDGSRILSAYHTSNGVKLWVITESTDELGIRAATTILLPDEY